MSNHPPVERDTHGVGVGATTRRGSDPPLTVEEADALFAQFREDEYGWLQQRILQIAHDQHEFHGDYLMDVEIKQRSMIGAMIKALLARKLIESTDEHRKSTSAAAHYRRSYVYVLTHRGRDLVSRMSLPTSIVVPDEPTADYETAISGSGSTMYDQGFEDLEPDPGDDYDYDHNTDPF